MKDLYLLVDGTHADPDECDVGADHELRHANGMAVALREDGTPQTIKSGAVENKNVEAALGEAIQTAAMTANDARVEAGKEPLATTDMEPEPPLAPAPKKAGYKTRGKSRQ